ncbi:helix-turn-helix domain-containing protein [Nocardia sp. NPDC050630]|uniref:helix-turn-helix domain-containing protein n=1 Tax=Nocardia sp. NPDC050630 TaxID=3364321 RepID=UPI0037912736
MAGRYVEQVRVDAAQALLESSTDGVATIARHCGCGSEETMRRIVSKLLGITPTDYRHRFHALWRIFPNSALRECIRSDPWPFHAALSSESGCRYRAAVVRDPLRRNQIRCPYPRLRWLVLRRNWSLGSWRHRYAIQCARFSFRARPRRAGRYAPRRGLRRRTDVPDLCCCTISALPK